MIIYVLYVYTILKKKSLKATSAYDWTCSNTDWFFDAISTLPQEIDALFPYSYRSRAL